MYWGTGIFDDLKKDNYTIMRKKLFIIVPLSCFVLTLQAQRKPDAEPAAPRAARPADNSNIVRLALDSSVTTSNAITIKGQRVPYTVTAGSLPVWDESGKPLAGVFYTYY